MPVNAAATVRNLPANRIDAVPVERALSADRSIDVDPVTRFDVQARHWGVA